MAQCWRRFQWTFQRTIRFNIMSSQNWTWAIELHFTLKPFRLIELPFSKFLRWIDTNVTIVLYIRSIFPKNIILLLACTRKSQNNVTIICKMWMCQILCISLYKSRWQVSQQFFDLYFQWRRSRVGLHSGLPLHKIFFRFSDLCEKRSFRV